MKQKVVAATYKCLSCGFTWSQAPAQVCCPECRHHYVKWVNFKQ